MRSPRSRIERVYVIDSAVRDMHVAAAKLSKAFGIEGVRMFASRIPRAISMGFTSVSEASTRSG